MEDRPYNDSLIAMADLRGVKNEKSITIPHQKGEIVILFVFHKAIII